MPTSDDIRQDIELKVVELLKQKVEDGAMTEERSQTIAKLVLDTLRPGMNLTQLFQAIPKLDDSFPELSQIILPYLHQYEDNITNKAKETIQTLIKQGHYDAATKLAKDAINQEVELVITGSGKAH